MRLVVQTIPLISVELHFSFLSISITVRNRMCACFPLIRKSTDEYIHIKYIYHTNTCRDINIGSCHFYHITNMTLLL